MAQDTSAADCLRARIAPSGAVTEGTDWTTAPLRDLIAHLISEHHDYVRAELPILQRLMDEAAAAYAQQDGTFRPLVKIFDNLRLDLLVHMEKEELLLFPAIARYEAAVEEGQPLTGSPFAAFGGPVNIIEHEHESVGAAIRLIRDFTQNYGAPAGASDVFTELIQRLESFQHRLHEHMLLENNVLFARAASLNSRRSRLTQTR